MYLREAKLYEKLPGKTVRCDLCEHHCEIENGESGFCRARENRNGILYTLVYGYAVMHKQTSIERQNFYHFYPGSKTFAIGAPGCNFRCWWCSDWKAARMPVSRKLSSIEELSPARIIGSAKTNSSQSITYTHTEPTAFFEYAYDISRLAKRTGLKNLLVSNGFMSRGMLDEFLPYLNAVRIDLKTFRKKTFFSDKKINLDVMLNNMKRIKAAGAWLEVSTLLISGVNEDPKQLRDLAGFISQELGPETPWHINRLFPTWDLSSRPPDELEALKRAKEIGLEEGLKYVYIERILGEYNTMCSECGQALIERDGYLVNSQLNQDGACPACLTPLEGIFPGEKKRKALIRYDKAGVLSERPSY
jgi:pyruvate formate lyase activating enzyme